MAAVHELVSRLFGEAKSADEASFVAVLLRGHERLDWDPFIELQDQINHTLDVVSAPLIGDVQVRLLLLLYSYLVEVSDPALVIKGLLDLLDGDSPLAGITGDPSPSHLVEEISAQCAHTPYEELAAAYEEAVVFPVIDAFRRSQYALHAHQFVIKVGRGVQVEDHLTTRTVDFDWLIPRIYQLIDLTLVILEQTRSELMSYRHGQPLHGDGDSTHPVYTVVEDGVGVVALRYAE